MPSRHLRAGHLPGPVLLVGADAGGRQKAAGRIADALRMPLYRADLAGVVSKYVGETEKNLDRIFARAAASGAVLLLDEADALLGRRTSVRDNHDRYANRGVCHLLARVEAYDGVVILATNREEGVDPELARRVRWAVRVGGS